MRSTNQPKSFIDKLLLFLKTALTSMLIVSVFVVLSQDLLVFPGAMTAILVGRYSVPKDVEEFKVTTRDNQTISVWLVKPAHIRRKEVALLFHGNAESLSTFVDIQRWFASNGFANYAVEYRGYTGSSGFPSEKGLYLDGEAAMNLLLKKEDINSSNVVILGNSIGTGPASFIAQKYKVNTLVLIAPYSSLKNVVAEMPFFSYLSPFLWYHFPTKDYIEKLTDTCVVNAHGKLDTTIPYHHSEALKMAYKGKSSYTLIYSNTAGHNDILHTVHSDLMKELNICLSKKVTFRE